MTTSLAIRGGRVIDPANGLDAVADVLIADGRVTPPLNPDTVELPEPRPATTGTTATDALLAERRSDTR